MKPGGRKREEMGKGSKPWREFYVEKKKRKCEKGGTKIISGLPFVKVLATVLFYTSHLPILAIRHLSRLDKRSDKINKGIFSMR